jgi:hypothetical protein
MAILDLALASAIVECAAAGEPAGIWQLPV